MSVMIPDIVTVMCTCYVMTLIMISVIPVMIPVIGLCLSRYDYHMICNFDSICLDYCGMR